MRDLSAIVKDVAKDAVKIGEDAGKSIRKHYEDIADGLKKSAKRYLDEDSAAAKKIEDILKKDGKGLENDAGAVGKDATGAGSRDGNILGDDRAGGGGDEGEGFGEAVQGEREYQGTRLVRAGRTAYEFDAQGRVVRKVRRTLSGQVRRWTFAWDADDKLTEATTPDGSTWRYSYDAFGRRVSKQRIDVNGGIDTQIQFSWDGTRLAEETVAAQSGETRSVTWDWEPGTDRVAAQTRRRWATDAPQEAIDAEFHAVITDWAGTPTELLSPDGRIDWRAQTSVWGAPRTGDDDTRCPLRFPGQYHDPETGLDYNYLRYYDPETARYVTPDPLGLFPQPDDYGYTSNPLVWIDPLGLRKSKPHFADVTVYDPQGNIKHAYSLRSGNQLQQEAALGFPNNAQASHTEARSMRMHGASPTVPIPNDPIANTMPVSPGDRIEVNGTKPPCTQCKGAMNRAVNELGVSVNYNWKGNTWSATG